MPSQRASQRQPKLSFRARIIQQEQQARQAQEPPSFPSPTAPTITIQDDRESELSDLNSTLFRDNNPFETLPVPTPPPRPSSTPPTIEDTKTKRRS